VSHLTQEQQRVVDANTELPAVDDFADTDNTPAVEWEECDLLRMQRPNTNWETDTAEFYRWNEYGGKRRERPLDPSELTHYLVTERGWPEDFARDAVERDSLARKGDKELWVVLRDQLR
jgi:hypothetical protein